jgi:choline kinase
MKIIVTASGGGRRFYDSGFQTPKYKIIANGHSLFYWSLLSLKSLRKYFFCLIFNRHNYDKQFVEIELQKLSIKNYKIIVLPKITDGQATTAMAANKFMKSNDSVVIYNIDTYIKPGIINRNIFKYDGNITTAKAKGNHWSFVKLGKNGFATATSEKIRISSNCSIGSYYFKR